MEHVEPIDEIQNFWDARYLSSGEAAWRIMGFKITRKEPAVTPVPVHLPGDHSHHQYLRVHNDHGSFSSLERYFLRPHGQFRQGLTSRNFNDLTYGDYFSLFRLTKYDPANNTKPGYFRERQVITDTSRAMHVVLRNASKRHLSRLQPVRPSQGELFYLRTILQHHARTSFEDARTVDGILYGTYQEAATHLGLFADDNEAEYAMHEAVRNLRTPRQLRVLFIHLLVNDCVPTPMTLWNDFRTDLARDYTLQSGNMDDVGANLALQELSAYLEEYGKTLIDYGLPQPISHMREVEHELARWGRDPHLLSLRSHDAFQSLNSGQREIYNEILFAVTRKQPLRIFVDGKAGRGKTFMVNAICNKIRSLGLIVLPTATAAFAAQLYPGGRTTHSAFKVRHCSPDLSD